VKFSLSLAHLGMLDAPPPLLLDAAHAAGFASVGVRLNPARVGETPFPMAPGSVMLRETLARMRDLGMTVHDVEIIRIKPDFDARSFDGVLDSAQQLGARCLMVNVDDTGAARAAASIGALAERAQAHDLELGVEFMVYTAARSLRAAQQLVAASRHHGVSVVVDALHFFRAGMSPAAMDGAHVNRHYMQINDAPAQRHPGLSASEEGRAHRLFPGEGELRVNELLRSLAPGATLSVEAPSLIRSATLDVHARAAAAYCATTDFLRRSGHEFA
jgi:sugar phosphate isomerase/epimerase